jgi:glutamine amidotransferase
MGNIGSVEKALAAVGLPSKLTADPEEVAAAEAVILPGVGAFSDAMERLRNRGLDAAVHHAVEQGRPFLGICLGLQLLFSESEENNGCRGLDIIPGTVRRLPPGQKIPHMGWARVERVKEHPMMTDAHDGAYFYFVHSYAVFPDDPSVVLAYTDYTCRFASAVARDNLVATQFHPEKSSRLGLSMLKNFGEMMTTK